MPNSPYRNLILTGTFGVGKTVIGQAVAQKTNASSFIDLETSLYHREGYTPEQIRKTFGIARLRSLENELIQESTLRRSTVIAVRGNTLLEPTNFEKLAETGAILCLTAALGEILRRLHVTRGGWFHDLGNRAELLVKLKRERQVLQLDIPKMDTTSLTVEEVTQKTIDFWVSESDM